MSDPNEATERNQFEEPSADTEQADTDRLEGSSEDASVEGDSTATEEHPETHAASEPQGQYTRMSDAKPHPGPHKA